MSWYGLGHAAVPDDTVNAEVYTELLQEFMLGSSTLCFKTKKFIFQQDNARPHTAKATKAWLAKHKIELLPWPANSPDMNPIEHMWWKIKSIIRAKPIASNVKELWKLCLEAIDWCWSPEGVEYAHKLVDSMPERVAALVRARGGYTRY
jgi:hypothetical protein